MALIDKHMPIGQLVVEQPDRARLFERLGLDYCCTGRRSLGEAWNLIAEAGKSGPLDERTCRLVKRGIAIGALREGAVHCGVRKAIGMGMSPAEIEQVVALTAGTLGLPSTMAAYTWVQDIIGGGRSASQDS